MRALFPVVLAGLLVTVAPHARAGDLSLRWKTIETEHFLVHYYEPLDDVAHRVAVVAERSHRVLAPDLGHEPEEKTHVVLVDDTDGANGFANVLPRNSIRLFASAPTELSALGDHDDWLYGLVAHEYTHVLHLDTIRGLPKLVNKIVGKTWAPNQIQPRWLIEGIATYEESRQSSSGRLRNALFDMQLRVAVLENVELDLDALSHGPRAWPHGNAAYLYGSYFLAYIFDRYGADKIAEWSDAYASNPIPYGLNASIKSAVGKTFIELYAEWRNYMRDKYEAKIEAIERRGRIEGRRMTFSGETNTNAKYTEDGTWIVWRDSDGKSRGRFRMMPSGGNVGDAVDYAIIDRAGEFDLLPGGDMLVEQTRNYRTQYDYQDLWIYERATGAMRPLTYGKRARDPRLSPDGDRIAFVLNGESRSRLALMPARAEADHEILWEDIAGYAQVNAPAWSPDGKRIAFSAWRTGGYRDILIVDVDTRETVELMHDRALDVDPVFSPDGRYLYYSSDRTGIYNVYAYDFETAKTWQVTNVVGCAVLPDVSPDGKRMVYRGFDIYGQELYELELDPERWLEPELYVNDRPDPTEISMDEVQVSAPRDYRPYETLAPQRYELQLSTNSFGNAITATTSGSDIVGHHGYSLGATLGFTRGEVSVGASYSYRRLWPGLRIAANRSVSRRTGFIIDGENTRYTEVNYGASARVELPVSRGPTSSNTLAVNYDIDWHLGTEDEFDTHDPNDTVPRPPETNTVTSGVGVSWRYSATRGFNFTVGPQEGNSFTTSIFFQHPSLGSDFHGMTLNYRWDSFYPLPWGETPVLSLRIAGGIRTNNRDRSSVFVIGGVPDQDIPRSIRETLRAGGTGYLRGYEPRSVFGNQFHLANVEYRQLVTEIERGVFTLPFYVRRLHVAGLVDVGNAYFDGFDPSDFKVAAGGSLRLDVVFGYFAPGTLDLGYARGLTEDGLNEFWFLLTSTL